MNIEMFSIVLPMPDLVIVFPYPFANALLNTAPGKLLSYVLLFHMA
jgi:hypothetical protein